MAAMEANTAREKIIAAPYGRRTHLILGDLADANSAPLVDEAFQNACGFPPVDALDVL